MPAIGRSFAGWRRRVGSPPSSSSASCAEALQRLGLQPAIGQFLDAVGEPAFQEAAVIGRRLGLEEIAPLLLEFRCRCRFQRRQAAKDAVIASRCDNRRIAGFHRLAHSPSCRPLPPSKSFGMTALVGGIGKRTFSVIARYFT